MHVSSSAPDFQLSELSSLHPTPSEPALRITLLFLQPGVAVCILVPLICILILTSDCGAKTVARGLHASWPRKGGWEGDRMLQLYPSHLCVMRASVFGTLDSTLQHNRRAPQQKHHQRMTSH